LQVQCPKCRHLNNLDVSTYWNYEGVYRCDSCNARMRIVIAQGHLLETPEVSDFAPIDGAPPEVNEDFIEAQKCYSAEAYKATIVICRRALENMADSQQAKGQNLFEKIRDLYNREAISKGTFEIATQVRQFGNYGAHPKDDLLGGITEPDAGAILEITQHLLKDVYEIPEKVGKLKKRLQKETNKSQTQ
jgi:hypothetical protein